MISSDGHFDVTAIYEAASPAVVEVRIALQGTVRPSRVGSGFLIDAEGHIVTNNHVVDGAAKVEVALSDDDIVMAKVVGRSTAHDLALLKIEAEAVAGIRPLALGDSSTLKPGQLAIAIGNPFGLTDTITLGVISGLDRSLPAWLHYPLSGLIQTDAVINPGSSGGPLLNWKGEVVGINTASDPSTNGVNKGIGFAVPVNTLKLLLPRLMDGGIALPAFLGIRGVAVTPALQADLSLPGDKGVYVVYVMPGSPAARAGLVQANTDKLGKLATGGDMITAVDGEVVGSVEDIADLLTENVPGDSVRLTVLRRLQILDVEAVLGEWPQTGGMPKPP